MASSAKSAKEAEEPLPVCKVAIAGFGTVGASVAKILCERYEGRLQLTHVYNRGVHRKRVPWMPPEVAWTEDVDEVLDAPDVDVFIELIGGLDPAKTWVTRALRAGKSVITANKQLVAAHGPELAALAREHGQQFVYGASVAGGVPVLSGLQTGLGGDRLVQLSGILNGTCNYILSKIEQERTPFADALKEAQKLGFAEADPTEDLDGLDARAKITILTRSALHVPVRTEQIECASIREIDAVDFEYAHQLKCTIRQISQAQLQGNTLFAAVRPTLVPLDSPLARVCGSQNLVVATGEYGGDIVFGGAGAGGNPTAVAVVSDLLEVAAARTRPHRAQPPATKQYHVSSDFVSHHYLRFTVCDQPGIIASLASILSQHGINIDSVLQNRGYTKDELPFVITLEPCNSSAVERALAEMAKLPFNVKRPLHLPFVD